MTGWIVALAVGLAAALAGWVRAVLRERHTSQLVRSASELARTAAQARVAREREVARAAQTTIDAHAETEASDAIHAHTLSDHLRGLDRAAAAEITRLADEPTPRGGRPVR